jgi:hypothetical protein
MKLATACARQIEPARGRERVMEYHKGVLIIENSKNVPAVSSAISSECFINILLITGDSDFHIAIYIQQTTNPLNGSDTLMTLLWFGHMDQQGCSSFFTTSQWKLKLMILFCSWTSW